MTQSAPGNPSTAPSPVPFDAVKFKETTRAQWQEAADAWHRWAPALGQWLGPATERMLDLAGIGTGHRVLDVAAGAGRPDDGDRPTRRPHGIGPRHRSGAAHPRVRQRRSASDSALRQVETRVIDGEELDLPRESFDAVVSRVGLIYFPDQPSGALRRCFACSSPEGGPRTSSIRPPTATASSRCRSRSSAAAPAWAPPRPGSPDRSASATRRCWSASSPPPASATSVVERVPSPVRLSSAAECLRFEKESFGALHQMLSGLSPAEREAAWQEVGEALRQFETGEGFVGPCEMLVAAGTR